MLWIWLYVSRQATALWERMIILKWKRILDYSWKVCKRTQPLDFSKISPEQARNVEMTLQAAPIEKLEADIEDRDIAGGPTGEVSIKLVRPPGSRERNLPVVVYLHGGGWVCGGFDTHDRLIRELTNGAQGSYSVR